MLLIYLIDFVSIIALLPLISAQRGCDISNSSLNLRLDKGMLRPPNWPINIPAQQYCTWTFPNKKIAGKALFLYIHVMDMLDDRKFVGDIIIGNEPPIAEKPTANCRLYGEAIRNVNTTVLSDYFASRHGPSLGRHCAAWFIDNQTVDHLTFRSRGEAGGVFNKKGFFIFYDYIPVNKGSATMNFDEPNLQNGCENQTTNVPAIVLATLLAIVCLLLIYVLVRQRRSQSIVLPRTKNDCTNSAYASTENTPYQKHGGRDSIPTYDVPTNNRLRTPTIASCTSTGSESPYQVPTSRPVVVDHPIPEQPDTETGYVYAEVRKNKKGADPVAEPIPEQPNTNVGDIYAAVRKRQEQ